MKKMNEIKILKIIVALIGVWCAIVFYRNNIRDGGTVTKKEFRDYRKEFRAEMDTVDFKLDRNCFKIDTLLAGVDTLKLNVDSIMIDNEYILYNQDSLKRGQIIIYRKLSELKADKKEDRKFLDKLKKLIK